MEKQKQRTLVAISDSEVLINFAFNTKCRANIRLRSLCATAPVGFKVQTSSPHKFLVNPPSGLVQPLSNTTLQIVLKPQNQIPPTFPRSPSDRFLIKTALSDSAESSNSFLRAGSTQDVKLKVAFVGPVLLKHAVSCGDLHAVKNIIKRQRSIVSEFSKNEAESLYRVAAELADAESMVGLLLQAGLSLDSRVKLKTQDLNSFCQGWSELHVAVAFDRTDDVFSLLKSKKYDSLDCRDKEGKTPLHLAASKGNLRCAQALLEYGADMDAKSKDGRSALYNAVANGDCRMVEMLIAKGANPTIRDDRGRSCFGVARDKGHAQVMEVLERGEEVLTAARRGDLQRLEALLDKGATTSYGDQYGLTAMHAAAIKGHKDAVLILIEFGADLHCRDLEGHTPLHMAVEGGSMETVEVLVDNGADVNAKTNSCASPLYMAQAMGCDDIASLLINRGASSSLPLSSSKSV